MSTLEKEKIITLEFPINLADRTLTEVTMRRPTVEEELNYAPNPKDPRKKMMEDEITYISHLCNIKKEEVKQMDMADYERLLKTYLFFRTGTDDTKGINEAHSIPE